MFQKISVVALFLLISSQSAHAVPVIPQATGPRAGYHYFSEDTYPYVLSEAIDVLPSGYVTIVVGGETFFYSDGMFFQKSILEQKYMVVPPPIGAVVFNIPQQYQLLRIDGSTFYVYDGVYYKRVLEGYKVIKPPAYPVMEALIF